MRPAYAVVPAAVPVVALIGGLPFANRLEPAVLGMPFLLVWILAWVALTPAFLGVAYAIYQRSMAGGNAGPTPPGAAGAATPDSDAGPATQGGRAASPRRPDAGPTPGGGDR